MGEYAQYGGDTIKIGTCEDMYYLRADQRHLVQKLPGSVSPWEKGLRLRFPWPDEDGQAPGTFEPFRGLVLADEAAPEGIEHYGYKGTDHTAISLVQQKAMPDGRLVLVCQCDCGGAYRIEDRAEAAKTLEPILDLAAAAQATGLHDDLMRWCLLVVRRSLDGYGGA
jgi:hypothetical protein